MTSNYQQISDRDPVEIEATLRLSAGAVAKFGKLVQPLIEQAVYKALAGRLPPRHDVERSKTGFSVNLPADRSEPILLNIRQVAKLLGVSERTVSRQSNSGEMPKQRKIGNLTRWSLEEVKAWIAAGCPKATETMELQPNRERPGSPRRP